MLPEAIMDSGFSGHSAVRKRAMARAPNDTVDL
jgi:hypothetical protein